jgi:hypothetical protein
VNRAISLLSRRRVFRTLALWLGLAALMVQGLAPLCAPGLMGGSGGSVASIVICTVHGFETVQIGADGKPLPQQPAKNASDCCTACHAPNGFTTPSPILAALPFGASYERAPHFAAPVVLPRFYSSYISRGPPPAMSREFT